jgi:hypothetical protein
LVFILLNKYIYITLIFFFYTFYLFHLVFILNFLFYNYYDLNLFCLQKYTIRFKQLLIYNCFNNNIFIINYNNFLFLFENKNFNVLNNFFFIIKNNYIIICIKNSIYFFFVFYLLIIFYFVKLTYRPYVRKLRFIRILS